MIVGEFPEEDSNADKDKDEDQRQNEVPVYTQSKEENKVTQSSAPWTDGHGHVEPRRRAT